MSPERSEGRARSQPTKADMRWLAYSAAALVALALLVTAVGAPLPRDHVAAVAARIAAPADTVFATLANPSGRKFGAAPTPHVVALEAPGASRGL